MIRASGSHYDVGCQIGAAAGASLRAIHEHVLATYAGRWPELLAQSRAFMGATRLHLPHVVDELRGAAEGSGVPFDDLFLMSIEELLNEEVRGEPTESEAPPGSANRERPKGCSDLAAGPPATANGHVWAAHNNDLGPEAEEHLFVTRVQADGEPEIMSVTVGGIFISIGFNSAGISLTGDQLYANDSRVGVPRLLIVRDILAQTELESAVAAAMLPARASSYNNLIASADGRIVNVEGSATDCDLLWATGGATFHTNSYRSEKMKPFEVATYDPTGSETRCSRAAYYVGKYHGEIGRETCEKFLRDHVFAPWSICRHSGDSVTVFSAIIDVNEREMWLARGNPCVNPYERLALD